MLFCHHLCIIFATIKKQVIKFIKIIKVLKNKLTCACFRDNIGISGSSSSVLPIRWSTVRHQINHNIFTKPILYNHRLASLPARYRNRSLIFSYKDGFCWACFFKTSLMQSSVSLSADHLSSFQEITVILIGDFNVDLFQNLAVSFFNFNVFSTHL